MGVSTPAGRAPGSLVMLRVPASLTNIVGSQVEGGDELAIHLAAVPKRKSEQTRGAAWMDPAQREPKMPRT